MRRRLALILGSSAGYLDAIGYLTLGLFTANMTGNTVLLGIAVGQGQWVHSGRIALAIAFFVGGAFGGALLLGRHRRIGHALVAETALLLGALGTWLTLAEREVGALPPPAAVLLIVLLSAAMGVQSAAVRRVGEQRVATTYVTGTLTTLAIDVAGAIFGRLERHSPEVATRDAGDRSQSALPLLGGLWVAYLSGALVGAFVQQQWAFTAVAVPVIVVAGVTAWDLVSRS